MMPYKPRNILINLSLTKTSSEVETVKLAGRVVSVTQAPHIRADIAEAKTVLERLLQISSVSSVVKVSNE